MEKTLYLECYSGISGDMTVGALLDLGADQERLLAALKSLPLSGYQVKISRVKKAGIDACDFHVVLDQENHDHDMKYLYGHHSGHDELHGHAEGAHSGHSHGEEAYSGHGHSHGEEPYSVHTHGQAEGHPHTHVHRGMTEIREIIMQGDLTKDVQELAIRIFEILAEAESKAHDRPREEVHFHEVGAVDSIVDIVAAAVCMDDLGIGQVIVPELREGRGTVRCQHGILPVPVPAVVNIVQAHQLRLHIMEAEGEFVTPTGAAVVAAVKTKDCLPEHFTIQKVGLGAGKRITPLSGLLRAMLIDPCGQ